MTDQELLESAAKAMGFAQHHSYREKLNALLWLSESGFPSTWSPLTDDKDAFQLAVDMKMVIDPYAGVVAIPPRIVIATVNNGDIYAAIRRAIVQVASEIGKGQE
jgi:hypothetical protein